MTYETRLLHLTKRIAEMGTWPEPLFYNINSFDEQVAFLRDVIGQPYPVSWYHKNTARTEQIFQTEYRKWLKEYLEQEQKWEDAKRQLKLDKEELASIQAKLDTQKELLDDEYEYKLYLLEQRERLIELLEERSHTYVR